MDGRDGWEIDVIEVITEEGEALQGSVSDDDMTHADEIFYSVKLPNGETYYRYLYGPFQSVDDLESAITDETDFYEELAG